MPKFEFHRMTGFAFVIIFGLSCFLCLCKGKVSVTTQTSLTLTPGSTEKIVWSFDDDIESFSVRTWLFAPSDHSQFVGLATVTGDGVVQNLTKLIEFVVEKPATLVLKNINATYNGTYRFSLSTASSPTAAAVVVFIAEKPTATVCPGPIVVNEAGGDVSCTCQGQGGNPPANVTWYKDGNKIGGTGKEEITLTLSNVSKKDHGSYECVAQSYPSEAFRDKAEVEVIVNSKPNNTNITFTQPVILGGSVEIKCDSEGVPDPDFIIMRPNGKSDIIGQSYTIHKVEKSDEGLYTCIATNALGNDSATDNFTVTVSVPTPSREPKSDETVWFIVIMSLLGVVIIGIVLSYIVWRSCRKFRISKHQSNPEPQTTEVDPTYQGLDLNKMNKEDNYQSLTGNYAASNDVGTEDESAYTELKKIRDVEDQYQSLQ